MKVTVAGVLNQLALGFLESLGLSLAGLGQRPGGLVGLLLGRRFGAHSPTDRRRLGGGRFLLFAS
jgi:hypothetical protein